MDFKSINKFWISFGDSFRADNTHVKIPAIRSANDFRAMLEPSNSDLFSGKNVVIFLDEFDLLCKAPPAVIDSVLNLFRGIKHKRDTYLLQVPTRLRLIVKD